MLPLFHLLDKNNGPRSQLDLNMQAARRIRLDDLLFGVPCELAKQCGLFPVWRLRLTHCLPCNESITMFLIQGFYDERSTWRKMIQVQRELADASAVIDLVCVLQCFGYRKRYQNLWRVVISYRGDTSSLTIASYYSTLVLRECLIAKLVHEPVGVEGRLHDTLIVDQAESTVKD